MFKHDTHVRVDLVECEHLVFDQRGSEAVQTLRGDSVLALIELIFEAENVRQIGLREHVDKRQEGRVVNVLLKGVEYNVEHAIGIEIKVTNQRAHIAHHTVHSLRVKGRVEFGQQLRIALALFADQVEFVLRKSPLSSNHGLFAAKHVGIDRYHLGLRQELSI